MTEVERRLYFWDLDPQRYNIRKQLCTCEFRISISKVFLKWNYLNAFGVLWLLKGIVKCFY